jgi:enoyl-CoA hydratase/carnithine racemase
MTPTDKVLFELRGHAALLTMNDPERRNALSREIVRGFFHALDRSLEAGARAIVVAARGPAFCAGANIDDLRDGWMEGKDPSEDPALLFKRLSELDRPVVAAIQGPALGGGMELMLACDLVVASDAAWFAMPELGHGVIPNTALALLPRVVGQRRALDLILTRRRIPAHEALSFGLVNRVVSAGGVTDEALELVRAIVETSPPGALAAAKANLRVHAPVAWDRVLSSPKDVPKGEWQEGLDAFTERRAASFERFWN